MNTKWLWTLWAVLFSLCAGLGFILEPEGALNIVMILLSVVFFLPPCLLLRSADRAAAKLIRNLSAMSLALTLVLLILNFATAFSSEQLGLVLHYILVIVSSPMICSGRWVMSLFLWACLLMASLRRSKR